MHKLNAILLVLVLASGLAVVSVQNQVRIYYSELNKAQKQQTVLEGQFSTLQLEQAQRSTTTIIKQAATAQGLHPPELSNTYIIERRNTP